MRDLGARASSEQQLSVDGRDGSAAFARGLEVAAAAVPRPVPARTPWLAAEPHLELDEEV